jgi:hypothetical protein
VLQGIHAVLAVPPLREDAVGLSNRFQYSTPIDASVGMPPSIGRSGACATITLSSQLRQA